MSEFVQVAIAIGELIDKITILELKAERLSNAAALDNVARELAILSETLRAQTISAAVVELQAKLKETNAKIWDLEDAIRDQEARKDFGPGFVDVARAIYRTNDARAATKREINLALGSSIIEEKSYKPY